MTEAHECNAHCYPPSEEDNMLRVDDYHISCVHCEEVNLIKVVQFIKHKKIRCHVVAMMPHKEWEHE